MTLFGMEVMFVLSLCIVSFCSLSSGIDFRLVDPVDDGLFKCGRNEADDCVEEEKEEEEDVSVSPFVSSIVTE